ncbi:hypothetical protein GGS23DRAFT_609143 [Durotheca rogersii]|uniref:uncharacterized protein n=1 Tax=Durotheca rogersii TaxID=419775 RepID=UPI00221EAA16|nr:uncharacterized protein GGS23DRAFT_609143 [Durotheca rogersii]KAI5868426.1 hypothetical protein GGS23DRAFT_609143 [Durotheca rogersii]
MAEFSSWFSHETSDDIPTDDTGLLSSNSLHTDKIIHSHAAEHTSTRGGGESGVPIAVKSEHDDEVVLAMAASAAVGEGIHASVKDGLDVKADLSANPDKGVKSLPSKEVAIPSSPNEPAAELSNDQENDPDGEWRLEQVYLNEILKARNEYSLMPSTWRMHFRGIPLPEGLFYTKTQAVSHRPRIYAHSEQFDYRGAMMLRRLIDLHGRVRDLRKAERTNPESGRRIVNLVRESVRKVLHWAELDGNIAKYSSQLVANVQILEMRDADRLDMDLHIQSEMAELAVQWREIMDQVPEENRPPAPVLFGFVIFKHILFIVTLDADKPDAACHIPCQLNLSEKNQHQWNALAIMITVCWARDLFADVAKRIPNLDLEALEEGQSSDPDA